MIQNLLGHNSLIKVDSDTFALAYGGDNGGSDSPAGFISTFTIDSDGDYNSKKNTKSFSLCFSF